MTNLVAKRTLSVLGLTISVSVALIVLFALCVMAGLAFPDIQATHAWVTLFTLAPLNSSQAWLEGTFFSLAFGVVVGSIVATVHNASRPADCSNRSAIGPASLRKRTNHEPFTIARRRWTRHLCTVLELA